MERVGGAVKGADDQIGEKGRAAESKMRDVIEGREREKMLKRARKTLLDRGRQHSDRRAVPTELGFAGFIRRYSWGWLYGVLRLFCHCDICIHNQDGRLQQLQRNLYRQVHEHVGKAIHGDLTGLGNVDVYAGVKYNQYVYILLYSRPVEKVDGLAGSLIAALDAGFCTTNRRCNRCDIDCSQQMG